MVIFQDVGKPTSYEKARADGNEPEEEAPVIKQLEDEAMDEADRYDRDDRTWRGVGFQVRAGRTRYGYDHDSAWAEIKAQEKALAKQRRDREKFLKALPEEMVDPSTGEIVQPATETPGRSVLAISFPKE